MKLKALSAYTKAKNCTDISDCDAGIEALNEYLKNNKEKGEKLAIKRLIKIMQKKVQFLKGEK
jgi:hypothetical protein